MKNQDKLYEKIKDGRYYQAMIQDSPVPMLISDQAGAFKDANDAAAKFFGYSIDELCGMGFQQVTHRDDMISSMEMVNALLVGKIERFEMVKRYLTKHGIAWAAVRVNVVRGDDEKMEMFVVHIVPLLGCSDDVMRDVVERIGSRNCRIGVIFASFSAGMVTAFIFELLFRVFSM